MSQVLFQDVLNACLGELMSISKGGKTTVYALILGNSTSSAALLQLITTLDLSSSWEIQRNFSFFVANVLPKMSILASLNLSYNRVGAAGAQSLAELTSLGTLTSLYLSENQIGAGGAQSIVESPALSNLMTLNLYGNQIGDDGSQSLAESTNLVNLTSLDLGGNQIDDDGVRFLAKSTTLSNLTINNYSGINWMKPFYNDLS